VQRSDIEHALTAKPDAEGSSDNAMAAASSSRHRPAGLAVLALGAIAVGVVLLLRAGIWLDVAHQTSPSLLARNARLISLLLVVLAILQLVLAYGLWSTRSWAWPFGVGVLTASIALTLLSGGRSRPGAEIVSLALQMGALWYLLSSHVRESLRAGD
jgi:uncharacterized membrane protein HdeD (DUF308 family)